MTRPLLHIVLDLVLVLLLLIGRGLPCRDGCATVASDPCARREEPRSDDREHGREDAPAPSCAGCSCPCQPPGLLAEGPMIDVPETIETFPSVPELVPPSIHHSPPDPVPLG